MTYPPAQGSPKRRRAWMTAPVILLLVACAPVARLQPASEAPRTALERMSTAGERMVVVVVDAGEATRATEADPFGARARRAARAAVTELERDYRLREVMEWPIVALASHCFVLEIEGTQSRDDVLAKLSRDKRVRLAQPLLTFRPSGTQADSGPRLPPGVHGIHLRAPVA